MYFLLKMMIFHCYVSLPEGSVKNGYEMGNIPEILQQKAFERCWLDDHFPSGKACSGMKFGFDVGFHHWLALVDISHHCGHWDIGRGITPQKGMAQNMEHPWAPNVESQVRLVLYDTIRNCWAVFFWGFQLSVSRNPRKVTFHDIPQRIHVWYIYLHLP